VCLPSRLIDRLPWQLFVHACRIVNKRSYNRRGLFQVIGLDSVEHVLIGVMGAGEIIDRVLDELESGQANRIKRLMICPASIRKTERFGADIIKWFQPAAEERAH